MSPELKCREMKYELYGILVHSGHTCNSGHYYSFCKSPSGTWFCYNDCNVSAVKPDVAMRQQEAYLLFYNKVSQNFAAGDPYSTSTPSVLQSKQKEQSSSNGSDRLSKEEIKRKEAQMAREILQKQNNEKDNKKSKIEDKSVNHKIEKSPIQQKMDLVRQTLSSVSNKSSTPNNEKKTEPEEKKSSPKKNKTSALSSIMEYDDSSTNDDSSINSTSSNSSRKERQRQKFLKRKAERLAKLGNLEDDDNNKKAETAEPSPKKPKTDNNSDNLQKYQNSSFFKLNVKSWNNQESSIDKQIDKEVRNQNNSKLDKETLAYDQDKIERAERKFEKVDRKKQEKMEKMSSDKSNKTGASPNVFQKHAEKGDRNKNKFYKK